MARKNGRFPSNALTPLSVGGHLRADAAAGFERLIAAGKKAGFTIRPTSQFDAYRTYAVQQRVFLQRYRRQNSGVGPYRDVRWWGGKRYVRYTGAAAAIPGTSNHGLGIAVDITGTGGFGGRLYKWLASNAGAYGWDNIEGRSVNESWHWGYKPSKDRYKGSKPKPAPTKGKKRKPKKFATLSRGKRRGTYSVGLWQNYLKGRGYVLYADRVFGNNTRAATIKWQRRVNLSPDGVVGILSWSRAAINIKPGSRGQDVVIWQRICGFKGKDADGIFGRATARRTEEVQRWLKVVPDADVGSRTIAAYRRKA